MTLSGGQPLTPRPTRWHVITGAPCSGKTAVIDALASRGFHVLPEAARAYIDSRLSRGESLAEIKADIRRFERHILMAKVGVETALSCNRLAFLDRAVPDSIAYYRLEGLAAEAPLRLSAKVRYRSIFLFDRLEFESDPVRWERAETAGRIERLIVQAYEGLGYPIVRVPVMSIARRTDFILAHVDRLDRGRSQDFFSDGRGA